MSAKNKKQTLQKQFIFPHGQTIEVCCCDITEEKTDCLAYAASSDLALKGNDIASAIGRRGGKKVQEECDAWLNKYGKVKQGEVALTSGGALAVKYIVHCVSPIWFDGRKHEDQDLLKVVFHALTMANDLQLKSISIAVLSTGIFGFPKPRCAVIMFHTAVEWFKKYGVSMFPQSGGASSARVEPYLKTIRFTNFDENTTEIFKAEFEKRFPCFHKGVVVKSEEVLDTIQQLEEYAQRLHKIPDSPHNIGQGFGSSEAQSGEASATPSESGSKKSMLQFNPL